MLGHDRFQVGERPYAVDLGLPPPKRAKVRTVEDQDLHAGSTFASDASTTDGSTTLPYSARPMSRSRTQRGSPPRDFLSWRMASSSADRSIAGGGASRPASPSRVVWGATASGRQAPRAT